MSAPGAIRVRICLAMVLAGAVAASLPARAATVVLRVKGSQIDEAVRAFKAELGGPVIELLVDEASSPEALAPKITAAGGTTLVAIGARAAAVALKQPTLPVVHCMVLQDAASFDTVRSAGVPLAVPLKTQLGALKRLVPTTKKVGVVYDPKLSGRQIEEAVAAARALGLTLVKREVGVSTEVPMALDRLLPEVGALLVLPDATVVTKDLVTFIIGRGFERRVPVLAYSESIVKIGALAAVAPQYAQNGALCARLAKRVIAGEDPGKLHGAVEMTGTLVVNVATARRIGVVLPPELLKPPTLLVGQ